MFRLGSRICVHSIDVVCSEGGLALSLISRGFKTSTEGVDKKEELLIHC